MRTSHPLATSKKRGAWHQTRMSQCRAVERRDSRTKAVGIPPLPKASGVECVRVLVSLGWLPVLWTERECQLEKGPITLMVPLDSELSSRLVHAIVDLARVGPLAFVNGLERLRTGRVRALLEEDEDSPRKAG